MTTPLRILLLSDGRPGHYHLAEGVCAALARLRPIEVARLGIERRRQMPTRLLLGAWRAGLVRPAGVLRLGYGLHAGSLPASDLVISAGGDTIAANIAAARVTGAANIYCGTLRHATPGDVTLTVSSYARHAGLPGHIVCLKPTAMDPDTLRRPQTIPTFGPSHAPRTAALLIGGDSGLFQYEEAEWWALLAFIEAQNAAHGTRWLVSTSRRTPPWIANSMNHARTPDDAIEDLLDYRTAGPGTLPRLLSRADVVLCTEDSSTMISEVIAARLPVIGVAPAAHSFKPEEADYRALMLEKNWARFIPLAALTPERFLAELAHVTPLVENHLDTLAQTLAARLPALIGSGT